MRPFLVCASAFVLVFVASLLAAEAAPIGPVAAGLKADMSASRIMEPVCSGCGCRGGPGYRTASGRCASWGRRR